MKIIKGLEALKAELNQTLGVSDWHTITQEQINLFAQATGDHQWIHVDEQKAKFTPFKSTIAHGFLTLSLAPMLIEQIFKVENVKMGINYGLNKVRFPAFVPVNSKVRITVVLSDFQSIEGGAQIITTLTFEREGEPKPVCVAETITRFYA